MVTRASPRSDRWTVCAELVDDFIGIHSSTWSVRISLDHADLVHSTCFIVVSNANLGTDTPSFHPSMPRNIKISHMMLIDNQLQEALTRFVNNKDVESAERLERIMDIQLKIQAVREWPMGIASTVPLIVTLVAAAAQIVVAVLETLRPWHPPTS